MLTWLLLSCVYRGPCPAEEDRFDPNGFGVLPESTFDLAGCDETDSIGLVAGMTVVWCTPEWCQEGYEGLYCVPGDGFESWREGQGLGLHCEPHAGPGGAQVCYIECEDCGDKWCV